jgi:hypothetical protein
MGCCCTWRRPWSPEHGGNRSAERFHPPEKFTPPKEGYLPQPPLKGCKRKHDRNVYESFL